MSLPSSLAFLAARRCSTTFLKITAAASTALCISASPNVVLCCWFATKKTNKSKRIKKWNGNKNGWDKRKVHIFSIAFHTNTKVDKATEWCSTSLTLLHRDLCASKTENNKYLYRVDAALHSLTHSSIHLVKVIRFYSRSTTRPHPSPRTAPHRQLACMPDGS